MTSPAHNWYQTNWQFILLEIKRIRQRLENYIEDKPQDEIPDATAPTSALAQLGEKFHLGLRTAQKTHERMRDKVTRLYEQGAGDRRIEKYVRRWW